MNLKNLKKAREIAGHNLNEVAVETGISYVTLSHAENGVPPKKTKTLKPILKYIDKHLKQSKGRK